MMNISRTKRRSALYSLLFVCGLLVFILFPVYWMVVSSFRANAELSSFPPRMTPFGGTIINYLRIAGIERYRIFFRNSVIVSGLTVTITLAASILAGYSLSRFHFFGRRFIQTSILSVQMFPVVAILISLYTFYSRWGLLDTYMGLASADITMALPFSIWFLKSFFDTVPRSLDEAARIDGCGRFQTLFQILVPLLKPGLLGVGIYTFLKSWDDFLFGLIIMSKDSMRTLPVGIAMSFIGEFVHDYAGMMTLSVIASVPVVVSFLFLQRYMIAGLTSGGVKG